MGQDDELHTSLAHIVLCCVAGNGLRHFSSKSFTYPGMHANFFVHGVLGFLHYQSRMFNNDFSSAYGISLKASKYLPLPCLMADLYSGDQGLCTVHLLSGVVPFALALSGNDNPQLANLLIACNVVSLCYYSHKNNNEWGWYTAGASMLAYFVTTQVNEKIIYPLALALMEYCASRMFRVQHDVAPVPPPRRQ